MTRSNAEFILVKRLGPLMTAAGMAITYAGSNADLNDPIGFSIRNLGYTVSDITDVSDADVAQVTVGETDEFLDVAELRTLEAILGNLDDVDLTVGPRSEKFSQLAAQVERKIERLSKKVQVLYSFGYSALEAGVITLNIAEHD